MSQNRRAHLGVVVSACLLGGWLAACTLITDFRDPSAEGEFRVNQAENYYVTNPRVAVGADGSFVVVWTNWITGADFDISVRVYGADGRIGTELTVNTITEGIQEKPDVAVDSDGSFVVVWEGSNPEQNGARKIYARRFDSQGNPLDVTEVEVNAPSLVYQHVPRVAMWPGQGYVVAWIQEEAYYSVRVQRYDADGVPMGQDILVSGPDELRRRSLALALAADTGDYTVVWSEYPAVADDNYDIHAVWFAAFGDVPADDLAVSVNNTDQQVFPSVAMRPAGSALIAWVSRHFEAAGTAAIRMLDANGAPDAEQMLDIDAGLIARIQIAMDQSGRFVAVYQTDDSDMHGICFRRFDENGSPLDIKRLVNTKATGQQGEPAVAMGPDGSFVVVWVSADMDSTSMGELDGIFARRYTATGKPVPAP